MDMGSIYFLSAELLSSFFLYVVLDMHSYKHSSDKFHSMVFCLSLNLFLYLLLMMTPLIAKRVSGENGHFALLIPALFCEHNWKKI